MPDIERLRHFAFLNDDYVIRGLQDELPAYLPEEDGCRLSSEEQKVEWWRDRSGTDVAKRTVKMLLLQASSAAAEHVFSILCNAFHEQEGLALADHQLSSVIFRYNHRRQA